MDFFREQPLDTDLEDVPDAAALRTRASQLIRGCRQHFRAGVTRIKHIGGVIPLGRESEFERMAHNLLDLPDVQAF